MSVSLSRRWLQSLLGIFVALALISCAGQPDPDKQPVQSPSDDLQYRLLTLDNEMEVIDIAELVDRHLDK